ncbi:MAG: D-sedoheptulose 7-phosphate isomerase [Acidobacteria bacterium]|nr:D-sedoheptulose 7-phosphate isomerase [Acidobacteriota bacterium]MBV8890998.1 D-sedoheptulose 7-phosphate isomerase [Acidobacteriota bacterium]
MHHTDVSLIEDIRRQIRESCTLKHSLPQEFLSNVCAISRNSADALKKGHTIFFCGNGGSAADAQHLAAEFVGRFRDDRNPLPAIALTVNTSLITAIANDYGYDQVFARQIKGLARPGDILFAISTSGNSPSILRAAQEARAIGMHCVGLTGRSGGKLREQIDVLLNVPSDDTPRIQEIHIFVGHTFCGLVEKLCARTEADRSAL